jgi:ElaB/YqjD/DUF883 family membrane-anchored ribosome-binding protein
MGTKDKVSKSTQKAFDKVANAAHQATDAMGEKGDQLLNTEQKLMRECRGYVRDNPLTLLGIAVAAGFLLSRLLGRPYSGHKTL